MQIVAALDGFKPIAYHLLALFLVSLLGEISGSTTAKCCSSHLLAVCLPEPFFFQLILFSCQKICFEICDSERKKLQARQLNNKL